MDEITNLDPIIDPPVESITYDNWFIIELHLKKPNPETLDQKIDILFRPYNKDLGKLYPKSCCDRKFSVTSLGYYVSIVPKLAEMVNALITTAGLMLNQTVVTEKIAALAEVDPNDAAILPLQAQLMAIMQSLGIQVAP
jgi:hypothetical protein